MTTLALLLVLSGPPAELEGPIEVKFGWVHDADTFYGTIEDWPAFLGEDIGFRLRGYAAPELSDPNPEDRKLALDGRDYVMVRITTALAKRKKVQIARVKHDKFSRRFDCDWIVDGVSLGPELHQKGFVKPWNGKGVQPFKENDP